MGTAPQAGVGKRAPSIRRPIRSNRAAARCELKDWRGAAADARRCTQLKPGWAKGWSRLGAAYYGLEQYTEVCRGGGLQGPPLSVLAWTCAVGWEGGTS